MTNKFFLFAKPKFMMTLFLSFLFAIIPIRQYRKFVYNYDNTNQGLGLGFADWFFRFQLTAILIIPFLLTWHWLNKEDEVRSIELNYAIDRINSKFNLGIAIIIYSLLGIWMYNLGTEGI